MAVAVTILTGEYAGKTAIMPDTVDPFDMLGGFAKIDVKWDVDYEDATDQEAQEWGRADMVGRILAAIGHGRVVRFDGVPYQEWRSKETGDYKVIIKDIDETLFNSGMNVYISIDNDLGVTISTDGTDHTIQ